MRIGPHETALAKLIATVGGVGLSPVAPGTVGSIAALPMAFGLHWLGGFPLLALASVAAFFKGWWATAIYTRTAWRVRRPVGGGHR